MNTDPKTPESDRALSHPEQFRTPNTLTTPQASSQPEPLKRYEVTLHVTAYHVETYHVLARSPLLAEEQAIDRAEQAHYCRCDAMDTETLEVKLTGEGQGHGQ